MEKKTIKTIIIAKLMALLITGLTYFIPNGVKLPDWANIAAIHMGPGNVYTYPGLHGMPSTTFAGFPFAYATIGGPDTWMFPIVFIIDLLIFIAACFAILSVINKEREKNAKMKED